MGNGRAATSAPGTRRTRSAVAALPPARRQRGDLHATAGGGLCHPEHTGGEPAEMASGTRHLVLRDLRATALPAWLPAPERGLRLPVQLLLPDPWPALPANAARRAVASGVEEIYAYRRHVDQAMGELLVNPPREQAAEIVRRVGLGLQHEQQHRSCCSWTSSTFLRRTPCTRSIATTSPGRSRAARSARAGTSSLAACSISAMLAVSSPSTARHRGTASSSKISNWPNAW